MLAYSHGMGTTGELIVTCAINGKIVHNYLNYIFVTKIIYSTQNVNRLKIFNQMTVNYIDILLNRLSFIMLAIYFSD